ncbi:MAG: MFS transporter, partial [Gemmatimonadales bacterium]
MKRISVLMATAFVDMMGFAIVMPLLPLYARRFDAPYWVIGVVIAVFAVMQLISAPLWGRFSDRFGRRPAILLGLCVSAVAFTMFAFADSILGLLATRLVQGIGAGTTGVLQAYVADSSAPKDRAKAIGWLTAGTSAGVMIGPVIGSFAVAFGTEYPGLIAAGLCLANIIFAWRLLPESLPDARERPRRQPIRQAMWLVLTEPKRDVSRLVWIYAVGMLGFMSMTSVMALYLESAFGITGTTIGPFFAYVGFVSLLMRAIVLGRAVDRFG